MTWGIKMTSSLGKALIMVYCFGVNVLSTRIVVAPLFCAKGQKSYTQKVFFAEVGYGGLGK